LIAQPHYDPLLFYRNWFFYLNFIMFLLLFFQQKLDTPDPVVAQCLGAVLGMFEQTCTVLPWSACKVAFAMSEFVSWRQNFILDHTIH